MIALLACALLSLSSQDAPALTPELLTNHPGLMTAEYERVREDWLSALEADPDSKWANAAARLIPLMEDLCADGIDPARLERLFPRMTDAMAQLNVKRMFQREVRRRRFSDMPYEYTGDLSADFVTNWAVLGPFGRLDSTSPLLDLKEEGAPHLQLKETYPSTFGPELTWRKIKRPFGRADVTASEWVFPYSGGTTYLLSFLEAPVEIAELEIQCPDALQVFWNGELVIEELRLGLTRSDEQLTTPVRLNPGANALLIRFANGDDTGVTARLNTRDGKLLAYTEPSWSPDRMPQWSHSDRVEPETADEEKAPFESVLDMLLAAERYRADIALSIREPANAEVIPAWLRARHDALQRSMHLPAEVRRRFEIEIEGRLDAMDISYPEIEIVRSGRLLREDKIEEAIVVAGELTRTYPDVVRFHVLYTRCLMELDETGTLARTAALEMTRHFPSNATSWLRLANWARNESNDADALEYGLRAMKADGSDSRATELVFELCAYADEGRIAIAQQLIDSWRAEDPESYWYDEDQIKIWDSLGDTEAIEACLIESTERKPNMPGAWVQLADLYTRLGREDEALPLYERALSMESDNEAVRAALEQRGVVDGAEEFFREFTPDAAEATAALPESTDASTALVLDSRMVFVRPDGSSRTRTHQIIRALNRLGTELLHEQPVMEDTRAARVIDKDGSIFEPVRVDNAWVMPSLDPGDSVEMIFDEYVANWPGIAPQLDSWFFESFEQPFIRSRYVLYLPDGVPGELKKFNFDGTHEEIPWRDGVVHILQTKDQEQLEDEGSMPSRDEMIAWIEYGDDINVDDVARYYAQTLAYASDVAVDIELELELLAGQIRENARIKDKARALYDAVTEHVLDFSGEGDTTDVWSMRRGEPTGLLAALFKLAEIEFEWAVFCPPFAPKLDPTPLRAFASWTDFADTCFRFAPTDPGGEPTWLYIPPGGRGFPFGRIPSERAGARVLVLEEDGGWRFEELPRPAEPTWDLFVDLSITVDADKSARVTGSLQISDLAGPLVREGLSQAEPEARSQWVRGLTSNLVGGLDLEDWTMPTLDKRGEDLVVSFRGTIPRFVRGSARRAYCKLPIATAKLSSISKTERKWPLVRRSTGTDRARVRIDFGDAWTYSFEPEAMTHETKGFSRRTLIDRQENVLEVTRETRIRGLWIEPEDVPRFLEEAKELEDAMTAKVELKAKE